MSLDINDIRSQFPALKSKSIYFDNPAGTQVAQVVLDRMNRYLVETNANHGGLFPSSAASDEIIDEARAACADFYNAARPEEIVFGANMTTLTFHVSRSLAHLLDPGDKIVVTRLDHDANITPWVRIAEERGAEVKWVDFDVEDGTLMMDSIEKALNSKPKLVAIGYASNALGTINPVKKITKMAHSVGSLVFIDAVQYAPHGVIDVHDLDCDFLVSSAYKFYGPHAGVLYGRHELLEDLTAYKVRPSTPDPPGKWETGTANFEGIAGVLGSLEYFESLAESSEEAQKSRRNRLVSGLQRLNDYEEILSRKVLDVLPSIPGLRIFGITDQDRLAERVPTYSFTKEGHTPAQIAKYLGENGINVWNGNYYALSVTERLGLEESGGMVRVGPVHYNTIEEIDRLGLLLKKL